MSAADDLFCTLTVQRDGDDHSINWCFDLDEQAKLAVKHCKRYKARILAQVWTGSKPYNEMLHDADELRHWLRFDYITTD